MMNMLVVFTPFPGLVSYEMCFIDMCSLSFSEWGHAAFLWTGIHAVFCGLVCMLCFVDLCSCCVSWTSVTPCFLDLVFMLFHGLVFTPCFMDLCSCCFMDLCSHHVF